MLRYTLAIALLSLSFALAACNTATPTLLPTATPAPMQVIPSSTPTPLPPPTVTPFPTATPRGGTGGEPSVAATADQSMPTVTATSNLAPTPDSQVSPTQVVPPTTSSAVGTSTYPASVNLDKQIFFADFTRGWPSIDELTAKVYLAGGQYIFEVGPRDARLVWTTAVNERNLYVQVEAIPRDCSVGGGYGLAFRFVDTSNYYLLTVFCDGRYTVVPKVDASIVGGISGALPGGLNAASGDPHRVGILVQNTTHVLYFDDHELTSFTDARLEGGDVAVYATSQSESVLQVAFDNLEVWTIR